MAKYKRAYIVYLLCKKLGKIQSMYPKCFCKKKFIKDKPKTNDYKM